MRITKEAGMHIAYRKIVQQLRMGRSLRAASWEVGAGFWCVEKAKLAQEAGQFDPDLDLPAFPEALF